MSIKHTKKSLRVARQEGQIQALAQVLAIMDKRLSALEDRFIQREAPAVEAPSDVKIES
jgi:hypothetical protein